MDDITKFSIGNLRGSISKGVSKEMVVYIMVEIRKIIERSEHVYTHLETLRYWCDWVVHSQLDKSFAKETLEKMEKYKRENPGDKFHHSFSTSQFISLEDLRRQLHLFCELHNLPDDFLNIPPWYSFAKELATHLIGCPLKKNLGLIREFKFIQKQHIPEAQKYSIDYEVRFEDSTLDFDGSVLRFER